jgi:hypothetical protein
MHHIRVERKLVENPKISPKPDFYLRLDEEYGDHSKEFTEPPRSGDLCPNCRRSSLDYDGLLNLACQECGYTLTGCFS